MMQQCSLDDDEEDLQQQCCQDDDPNLFMYGRPDTDAFSEVNMGKEETIEMSNKENIENVSVQEESQVATVQEESQAGASKPQERVSSLSVQPTVANIVTGNTLLYVHYVFPDKCSSKINLSLCHQHQTFILKISIM